MCRAERAQASYTPKRRILTLIAFFLVEVGLVVGHIFLSDRCGWIGDRDACGLPAVSVVSFRISLISFMLAYVLQACPLMKPALELNVGRERWRLTWVWGLLRVPSTSGLNVHLRGKVRSACIRLHPRSLLAESHALLEREVPEHCGQVLCFALEVRLSCNLGACHVSGRGLPVAATPS